MDKKFTLCCVCSKSKKNKIPNHQTHQQYSHFFFHNNIESLQENALPTTDQWSVPKAKEKIKKS